MSTNRRSNKRTARQVEMCVRRQVGGYSHQEIANLYAMDNQRVDPLSLYICSYSSGTYANFSSVRNGRKFLAFKLPKDG